MSVKLYGIGVGPGNPDLITAGAVKCIQAADIICIPTTSKDTCRAYQIARDALPEIENKECICLDCKMTRDENELTQVHNEAFQIIQQKLLSNKSVAFLTIGDPTVYSTFTGISKKAKEEGFPAAG